MADTHRKAKARVAAQEYAPRPEGSSLTYGLIGVATFGLALIGFGMFYNANVFAYPVLIAALLVTVFLGSVVLRKHRKRLHTDAYKEEYSRQDNTPPE
ncbi:hypothetical protein ASD04_07555 [Devosia sp. Root436]|jgi:hypothetical protein|uniref:hypothetical protein n=1 Tax=Devosia sp. Root436 TaxID=1736537 RepID=UPI0006F898B6|nr:hypothetical protein [Devosia sp. Root436]KQX40466.1 hypothetical protein ASD04_07555 [Devosia sp. Root436]